MNADQLKKRTQEFGASVIKLVQKLPDGGPAGVIGLQLTRCSTSVGSNYRSACRARSRLDFIAKLKIVEEECDESIYWLELLAVANPVNASLVSSLRAEANRILAIIVASIRTVRSSIRRL